MDGQAAAQGSLKRPFALEFRASVGFCTAVVFLAVFCDLLVYSILIPSEFDDQSASLAGETNVITVTHACSLKSFPSDYNNLEMIPLPPLP